MEPGEVVEDENSVELQGKSQFSAERWQTTFTGIFILQQSQYRTN